MKGTAIADDCPGRLKIDDHAMKENIFSGRRRRRDSRWSSRSSALLWFQLPMQAVAVDGTSLRRRSLASEDAFPSLIGGDPDALVSDHDALHHAINLGSDEKLVPPAASFPAGVVGKIDRSRGSGNPDGALAPTRAARNRYDAESLCTLVVILVIGMVVAFIVVGIVTRNQTSAMAPASSNDNAKATRIFDTPLTVTCRATIASGTIATTLRGRMARNESELFVADSTKV